MAASVGQVIARGLRQRCPNCGGNTVFRGMFHTNERCARCGLLFEREPGFWLGAMVIGYGATALPMIPLFVLVFMGRVRVPVAIGGMAVWSIIFPLIFFRESRSLWLMFFFLFFRSELPDDEPRSLK